MPSGPAATTASTSEARAAASTAGSTAHRPRVGRDGHAGQALRLGGVDPSPLGDDPVDGSGRSGAGSGQDRCDVEDLAAADGLGAAGLPQDVAIPGQQGQGRARSQPEADEPLLARRDRPAGTQDPHPDRVFAGAEVGGVGAAAGDAVADRGEHGERGVDDVGPVPLAGPDHGLAPHHAVVGDPGQVDGQPPAGGGPVEVDVVAVQAPDPGGQAAGLDRHLVVQAEAVRR